MASTAWCGLIIYTCAHKHQLKKKIFQRNILKRILYMGQKTVDLKLNPYEAFVDIY